MPVIAGRELQLAILHRGVGVLLYSKTLAAKCSEGWVSGQHDPDCGVCGGSGYTLTPKLLKVLIKQRDAHAQYNVENMSAVAGINERADFEMLMKFHDGRIIQNDDIIIYTRKYGMVDIELTVMSKKELPGTFGRTAGWRVLLFKSPKKQQGSLIPYRGN